MWSFSKIWNDSVNQNTRKPAEARDHMWASELGKADIDIYLRLIGEKPSNDFDARSLRKFEAGNLFEWVIKLVLIRCGIYQESQRYIKYKQEGAIEVTGKLDHIAGGMPRYEEAEKEIEALMLPEMFVRATKNILEHFKKEYPNGLPEQILEVKSTSSFGIEKVYFTKKALAGHDLQAFHYAYNTKIPAIILYVCRDDLRMAEIPVLPDDPELLKRYQSKIARVSDFYTRKQEPPKETEIVFDEITQRFSKNFNIEYSSYLTRNYGVENPEQFDEKFGGKVESWNRVITRVKDGKDLTDNNREKIAEMAQFGLDVIKLLESKS